MSATKRMAEEKKAKKTAGRRYGANAAERRAADWGTAKPEELKSLIVAAARAGGAVRFGYTADQGAYALGIYGDGDTPYTEYVRPGEDLGEVLRNLTETFFEIYDDNNPETKK